MKIDPAGGWQDSGFRSQLDNLAAPPYTLCILFCEGKRTRYGYP
jgi:hypothetical protein